MQANSNWGYENITLQLQQYVYFSTAQFSVLASIIFMFTPDWKKKDEEHAEWDRRRRNSQEQVGEIWGRDEALYIGFHIDTHVSYSYLVCILFDMPSLHF